MDLELARLAPHPEVPLRRQIAAWLASGIRDGEVPEGARLPSVRRLAELVGVHRNTAWAVYRELADEGLARRVRGSGVYAVGQEAAWSGPFRPPGSEFLRSSGPHAAIAVGEAAGVGEEAASAGALRSSGRHPAMRGRRLPPRRVVVAEEGEGLRTVLVEELRLALARTGVPVGGVRLASALARPDGLRSDLVVGLASACRRLARRRPDLLPEPLALRGGRAELRVVARLEPPVVVALLTKSRRVRRFAGELLAGWTGIGLAAPAPDRERAVARALRIADVVFADASCAPAAAPGDGRIVPLRCIRADGLARIVARLDVEGANRTAVARENRPARRRRRVRRRCASRSSMPA